MNFWKDVQEDASRALVRLGARLPDLRFAREPCDKARLLCAELFHQARRRIAPKPRTVLWSRELRMRPWSDSQPIVECIATELARGDDMNRRLSRSILKSIRATVKTRSYDTLLASWGIHHLHLGQDVKRDGFVGRTPGLLFVLIQDDTAYLLDRLDHQSFHSERLFQIVHDNWPAIVRAWRLPEVTEPVRSSARETRKRRRMRMTMAVGAETRDGVLYLPPGGGVMPGGHSFEATRQAAEVLLLVGQAEAWCLRHIEAIRARVAAETGYSLRALHMRFDLRASIRRSMPIVRELTSGLTIPID